MAEAAQKQLLADLKGLLASGLHSDFTVTCSPDSYKVHKNIVCSRADFFARAIKFGGKETEGNNIDLPEDEPAIVKLLIQYIYEGEYHPLLQDDKTTTAWSTPKPRAGMRGSSRAMRNIGSSPTPSPVGTTSVFHICGNGSSTCEQCQPQPTPTALGSEQLLTHAKMYEIAEKYDVVGLKDLVKEKYRRACLEYWNEPSFAASAHHAFSTTPDHDKGLRDIVSETIATHLSTLVKKPEIEALLTEFNGLAFGLLKIKIDDGWR